MLRLFADPIPTPPQAVEVGERLPAAPIRFCRSMLSPSMAIAPQPLRRSRPGGRSSSRGDATPQLPLRRAGERLRAIDIAVMRAAGIGEVIIRSPRLRIVNGAKNRSAFIDAAMEIAGRVASATGAWVLDRRDRQKLSKRPCKTMTPMPSLRSAARAAARVMQIRMLAKLAASRLMASPYLPVKTAAFGFVGARPVLLAPGATRCRLAVSFLIGRHLVAKLAALETMMRSPCCRSSAKSSRPSAPRRWSRFAARTAWQSRSLRAICHSRPCREATAAWSSRGERGFAAGRWLR